MEIQAQLVHRGHQGQDHPARIGTLCRKAHGGNHLRNRQQSCPHAVPTRICAGRYSEGRDSCHAADRKRCVNTLYFKRKADMKAARMHEYGKALVLEDVPVPDIKPDEVLVHVRACGMCRSDVQLIDGYFRKYADIPTPITPGHEITGVVHKVGGLVPKSVGEGDHVVVAPGWGDGTCRHCQIGNTHICPNVRWPGFGPYGGFAEFIPVPARYLIKVGNHLKFEELAPLTDAGMTPYRGIKKLRDAGALAPDRVLGVFGIGGLGAYAVQYAKLLGSGAKVVAFARNS